MDEKASERLMEMLDKAKRLELDGNAAESERVMSEALRYVEGKSPVAAAFFNQRGLAKRMLGRYDGAARDFSEVINHRELYEEHDVAHALVNMADIERVARNNLPSAHAYVHEALTYAGNGTLVHARAMNQAGLVFMSQGEHASAIAAYERGESICAELLEIYADENHEEECVRREIHNVYGQIETNLGSAFAETGNPDAGYRCQKRAADSFEVAGNRQGIVNAATSVGEIACSRGDFDEAIRNYEKTGAILEQTGYRRAQTVLSLRFARAYLSKTGLEGEEYEAARAAAERHLERFVQGVLGSEITENDMRTVRDIFMTVEKKYRDMGMRTEGFDMIAEKFASADQR